MSVAVDGLGNVYASGYQTGTGIYDYNNGSGIIDGTSATGNAVIVKYPKARFE